MGKGEETRERILARVAPLFNQRGYSGAAMSDVMEATGLEKGGIYRHFESKEALAVEAFDWASAEMGRRMVEATEGRATVAAQLEGLFDLWERMVDDPPIAGGCPVMNTAIENDDREGRDASRPVRALHPFGLNGIPGVPESRRVDQCDRHSADVHAFGEHIARRAGHVRDDRAIRAGECIEQTRLSRVRCADDHHHPPFAQHAAGAPAAQKRLKIAANALEIALGVFAGDKVKSFVRKVE